MTDDPSISPQQRAPKPQSRLLRSHQSLPPLKNHNQPKRRNLTKLSPAKPHLHPSQPQRKRSRHRIRTKNLPNLLSGRTPSQLVAPNHRVTRQNANAVVVKAKAKVLDHRMPPQERTTNPLPKKRSPTKVRPTNVLATGAVVATAAAHRSNNNLTNNISSSPNGRSSTTSVSPKRRGKSSSRRSARRVSL